MCGICISKINYSSKKLKINNILKKIEISISLENFKESLSLLRSLRCNYCFIELILKKNKILEQKLTSILENIKKKISFNQNNTDIIRDIVWTIESEIFFKCKKISNFLKKNKIPLSIKSIIFTRYLLYTFESINYLESRGRDSFGITINLISTKKNLIDAKFEFNNYSKISINQKKIFDKKFLLNLNFKYAKRIGYSGENTDKIINLIFKSKILKKINFKNILSSDFIAHTRWASVGEVNLSNTHPVIDMNFQNINLSFMNGDINNYKKIIHDLKIKKIFNFKDTKCSNDLQPISTLISHDLSPLNKILNGSYVIINFNSKKPYNLSIYKKGTQGLYFSRDLDDNIHFASDAYGLVNKSNKFLKIINDGKYDVGKNFLNKIKNNNFYKSDLMTNDLSKKGFERFFLKEINDTEVFLKRTINNYILFDKKKFKNLNNIFNITTLKKLKTKKIKNIIFTGMGSCYSAAVGISKYLSQKLYSINYNEIKVEATIASEGSGFYLSDDMHDTIIVVLAQSGTTIDTNVFAKMAKKRGAYTIALVNKKQGDVTFIVDKSFYLGNGRDIEMSVPSTKTYTCHLIMGYILSEKILNLINKKSDEKFISQSQKIVNSDFVTKKFNSIKNIVGNIEFDIFKYNNWIVLYDDSENAFAALELRIKISECCYKSVPYFHISNFIVKNFKNTLIFYLGTNLINKNIIGKSNLLICISKKSSKPNSKNNFNLILKEKYSLNLTIETALTLQLLAYRLSELIDKESITVAKITNEKKLTKIVNYLIDKINMKEFSKLSFLSKKKMLIEKLKRPIDAIKHQAKTVTVGATRSINLSDTINNEEIDTDLISNTKFKFKNKFKKTNENIHIIGNTNSDIFKYFTGNLVEYYNQIYRTKKHYKIYNTNSYKKAKNKKATRIYIQDNNIKLINNSKIIYQSKLQSSDEIIKTFLSEDRFSIKNELSFINAKNRMLENEGYFKFNLKEILNKFNNIKFLGSGINYLVAKKYAQIFSNKFNKCIAFDVIENHKHIDISSESLILIFASNINRRGFQNDVYSEVEKFIAHDNLPIVFTNIGNNIYDSLLLDNQNIKKRVIKFPEVDEIYSLSIFEFFFENFIV